MGVQSIAIGVFVCRFVCLYVRLHTPKFTLKIHKIFKNDLYVSLSSPGGRTGGEACRLRLHFV